MTVPGNLSSPLLATAAAAAPAGPAYQITKSLRFKAAESNYLHKTPSAGNRTTWTWSCWMKRGDLSASTFRFFSVIKARNDNDTTALMIDHEGRLKIGGYNNIFRTSEAQFRDPSAWMNIVVVADLGQSSAADRFKAWVNGVSIDWTNTTVTPTSTGINSDAKHNIGAEQDTTGSPYNYFDGYLTDVYFIDGSALDHTSFGQFDSNGVWQAIEYTGTYGTNGFNLFDFASESTIGHDASGNNNDYTAVNFSTSAGGGNDVLFDTPTNGDTSTDTGAGGEVNGCYAVLNPLHAITNSPTNGNLDIGGSSTGTYTKAVSTIFIDPEDTTGYYCEFTVVTTGTNPAGHIQLIPQLNVTNNGKGDTGGVGLGMRGTGAGNKWYKLTDQSSAGDTGVAHAANQVIGVAVKNGKLYMAINNTWVLSGNPATESNPLYSSLSGLKGFLCGTLDGSWQCNWGQRAFAYSAPSGYRPVSSAFLPTPTIADGSDYFETVLYTGNGATGSRSITGLSFAPDFSWFKGRSYSISHLLYDSVRGAGSTKSLVSNGTNAEGSAGDNATFGYLESFDSSGFSIFGGSDVNNGYINKNSATYASFHWDAGSSTASNTDGSITSSVRANQTAGFSVVTFTGTGANATVGHGLNAEPYLLLTKCRESGFNWAVYHKSKGNGGRLMLNNTLAFAVSSTFWNDTTPTNSVFSVGSFFASGNTFVAYCVAPVAGYSAVGSYTANGSSNGPFVHTGFAVAWLLTRRASSTGAWEIHNYRTPGYNPQDERLIADSASAEASGNDVDFLSNGFKIRNTFSGMNGSSGDVYIYWAVAENPFQANGGLAR